MEKVSWFIGPQLIGVVLLLVGYIQKCFPPKKINSLYGYRTPSSMKNQQTWDEANRYSAIQFIKIGAVLLIGGLLLTFVLVNITMPQRIRSVVTLLLILISSMGSVITMLTTTERHLEKTFDHKD